MMYWGRNQEKVFCPDGGGRRERHRQDEATSHQDGAQWDWIREVNTTGAETWYIDKVDSVSQYLSQNVEGTEN